MHYVYFPFAVTLIYHQCKKSSEPQHIWLIKTILDIISLIAWSSATAVDDFYVEQLKIFDSGFIFFDIVWQMKP